MASTPNAQFLLIDPSQIGKAAAIDTALTAIDAAMNATLAIQVDDGNHATPYTIPYGTNDEPQSPKTALRFVLLTLAGAPPADWTAYMPAGPTKLFLVQNNMSGGRNARILVPGQTGVVVPPGQTWLCYLNGTDVVQLPIAAPPGSQPWDIGNFIDGPPSAGLVVMRWIHARTVTFPANFSNNQMKAGTGATNTATFIVNKNGAQVGTATFSAGAGTAVWASSGGNPVVYNAGDVGTFVAPNPADATLADLDWIFSGTR